MFPDVDFSFFYLNIIKHISQIEPSKTKKKRSFLRFFLAKKDYSPSLFAIFSFNKSPKVVEATSPLREYFLIASAWS